MAAIEECFVRIAASESTESESEFIEVPTEADGTLLLLSNIQAQFPCCIGLRYRNPQNLKTWRGIRRVGDAFYPPLAGWGTTVYVIVSESVTKCGTVDITSNEKPSNKEVAKSSNSPKSSQLTITSGFKLGGLAKAITLKSEDTIREAEFFTSDKPLKKYHLAINAASQSLAKEDPKLLLKRGELLKRAREKIAEDGYEFKKGFSRSASSSSNKSTSDESDCGNAKKRKSIHIEERQQTIANTRELLESTINHIRIKQQRIQKQKGCNDFKKCDELTSEMRGLLKEKAQLENQLAALEKREAKSKWYKKKKTEKKKPQPETKEKSKTILEMLVKNSSSGDLAEDSNDSGDTVILGDDPEESSDNTNL